MKKIFILISLATLFFACKKNDSSPQSSIAGTWTFKSQISGAFPYPYIYSQVSWNYANSGSILTTTNSNDSLSIAFANTGNFIFTIPAHYLFSGSNVTYVPFKQYPGTYNTISDSFLIIQPGNSYLLSYTYTANLPANSSLPNGDTIYFKRISSDSLVFVQPWVTSDIYQPQDTTGKLLFLSVSGLRKIQ